MTKAEILAKLFDTIGKECELEIYVSFNKIAIIWFDDEGPLYSKMWE